MSFWYERMRETKEKEGLSNYELAQALEIDTSAVSRYEAGRGSKSFTRNIKRKLLTIFSIEKVEYIENGKISQDDVEIKSVGDDKIEDAGVLLDGEQISIPYHQDVYAAAGGGSDNHSMVNTSPVSFSRAFLNSYLHIHNVNGLSIINAAGNSMEPTIKSGELMFVYPISRREFKDGGIYVLMCSDNLLVKRVTYNPITREYTLVSDNGDVAPVTLTIDEEDDCRFVGRVVGHMDRV